MTNEILTRFRVRHVILQTIRLLVKRPRYVVLTILFTLTLLGASFQFYTNPKQTFAFAGPATVWRVTPLRRDCVWNETTSIFSTPMPYMSSKVDEEAKRLMFSTLPGASARLGNQMFGHAALLGVAHCTGYRPVVFNTSVTSLMILATFSLVTQTVGRVHGSNRVTRWTELQANVFTLPEHLTQPGGNDTSAIDSDIELVGYFQSWRYFADVTDRVMADFRFKPSISDQALRTIERLLPKPKPKQTEYNNVTSPYNDTGTSSKTVLVGIHVRRSDMAMPHMRQRGYMVADENYFHSAMTYIEKRILESTPQSTKTRIVYVVCTDDPLWTRQNIVSSLFPVIHSDGDYAVDLAVLASCDHVIISTGSYSWWAGFLVANKPRKDGEKRGIVIYYAGFPPPASEVGSGFRPLDVYPPSWIGLT